MINYRGLWTKIFCMVLVVFSISNLFGQNSDKQGFIILPLHNNVDVDVFSDTTAENIGEVIDKSLYAFIGVIPFLEVPSYEELTTIEWSTQEIISIAEEKEADFILYGDYYFYENGNQTMVEVTLNVWSQPAIELIFSETYSADVTSIELLDVIDEMIIDIVEATFSIDAKIASVKFGFDIGDDIYAISANNRELSVISNNGESYQVKILAENSYIFKITRQSDQEVVLEVETELEEGKQLEIEYVAVGSMTLLPINKATRKKKYLVTLDDKPIDINQTISNLKVTEQHEVVLEDGSGEVLDSVTFSIKDSQHTNIQLTDTQYYKKWHVSAFAGHNGFGGLGFSWLFNRKLYLGYNLSYSQFYSQRLAGNIMNFYNSLEGGYYLIGNTDSALRIGLGLNLGVYFSLDSGATTTLSALGAESWGLSAAGFAQVEWKFIYLKILAGTEILPNFGFTFSPAIGVKF